MVLLTQLLLLGWWKTVDLVMYIISWIARRPFHSSLHMVFPGLHVSQFLLSSCAGSGAILHLSPALMALGFSGMDQKSKGTRSQGQGTGLNQTNIAATGTCCCWLTVCLAARETRLTPTDRVHTLAAGAWRNSLWWWSALLLWEQRPFFAREVSPCADAAKSASSGGGRTLQGEPTRNMHLQHLLPVIWRPPCPRSFPWEKIWSWR